MFRGSDSQALSFAHVRMQPVHAQDGQHGEAASRTEPVGMQMLAVASTSGTGVRERRLAAAEDRGVRRAMAQVADAQQDVIHRLFAVTLQLASISQRRSLRTADPSIRAVIETVDGIIRDLRSLTIVR